MPAQSRIRIVVINNGGGKIFSQVASLRALPDAARAVIENRHTLSFRPLAELWGLEYRLAASPSDLMDLPTGPVVVEVRPRTA
jgi:2-succinyl-5-enolpyruvyl-6-hydroxy-3-cyclohexene-1-carboxylate synthase